MTSKSSVSRPIHLALLSLPVLAGCLVEPVAGQERTSLREARAGFKPKRVSQSGEREPVPDPPPRVFRKVTYPSPVGKLTAYISVVPDDNQKRPAIIWITGGDCNSVGDVWSPMPAANEQSASAYRKAGIVMMFPVLRGGNDNPGVKEGYFGEVDDVVAAADYLARQKSVDPQRIYLGGHSTGGTLALLVSECSDRFRAVFSFGPANDVSLYPPQYTPFDTSNRREVELRSPGRWIEPIQRPTFVIEGTGGNISAQRAMAKASSNPMVQFVTARGADHFQVLGPTNAMLARKILADKGTKCNITLTDEEASRPVAR
jgi:dipeptidyl aminopeptidase/acylaminoacyl peptidase